MEHSSILQLLAEITGTNEVLQEPGLALFETQALDSLGVIELIVVLQERFGIVISLAQFDRKAWATPEKFVLDVETRIAAKA